MLPVLRCDVSAEPASQSRCDCTAARRAAAPVASPRMPRTLAQASCSSPAGNSRKRSCKRGIACYGDEKIDPAAKGLSYAEITRACEEAIKEMLILDLPKVTNKALVGALTERRLHMNH